MANINIASLKIDVNDLLKNTSEVKKAIEELKAKQSEIKKTTGESSTEFIENAANLKVLQGAYNQNVKVLADNIKATADQNAQTQLLDIALQGEAKSINEAREQNSLLTKIRNGLNVSTEEGKKQLDELNAKINSNNGFIKDNSDALTQQKMNVGNYSDSIKDALSNLNPLNGGLAGFSQRSRDAGGAGNLFKESIQGVGQGVLGAVKAMWTFVANPIGLVITGITVVLALLISAFKNFTPVVDKVEQAIAAVGAVVNVLKNSIISLVTGTKSLTDVFSGLGSSMNSAASAAANLKKAQQELEDAQGQQNVNNAVASRQISELILKSKDRTKSEQERLAFIAQADAIEKSNFEQNKRLSDSELKQAQDKLIIGTGLTEKEIAMLKIKGVEYARILQDKYSLDDADVKNLEDALIKKEATLEKSQIFLEKNQNRTNKLIEDADAAAEKKAEKAKAAQEKAIENRKKIQDAEIQLLNESLDLFKTIDGQRQKTTLEQIAFELQVSEKKKGILDKELAYGKISKTKYNTEINQLAADNENAINDINARQFTAELNLFIETNKTKLKEGEKYTQEYINQNEKTNQIIFEGKLKLLENEKEVDVANIEIKKAIGEELTASELEFLTERERLKNELLDKTEADRNAFKEQVKIEKADFLAAENEVALAEADTALQAELLKIQFQGDEEVRLLKEKLDKGKLTEDQYRKLKEDTDKKTLENERLARLKNTSDSLQEFQRVGQGLETLFGKNKQLSAAMAVVNTGLAVTEILSTKSVLPEPLASISRGVQIVAALAQGANSIRQINDAKFEKGGITSIDGNSHAQGGVPIYAGNKHIGEAEGNEGIAILSRPAFAGFMDFNNSFAGGKSNASFFEGGGIITQAVTGNNLTANEIANVFEQVINNMPPPIVSVTDINLGQQRYANVVNSADF